MLPEIAQISSDFFHNVALPAAVKLSPIIPELKTRAAASLPQLDRFKRSVSYGIASKFNRSPALVKVLKELKFAKDVLHHEMPAVTGAAKAAVALPVPFTTELAVPAVAAAVVARRVAPRSVLNTISKKRNWIASPESLKTLRSKKYNKNSATRELLNLWEPLPKKKKQGYFSTAKPITPEQSLLYNPNKPTNVAAIIDSAVQRVAHYLKKN